MRGESSPPSIANDFFKDSGAPVDFEISGLLFKVVNGNSIIFVNRGTQYKGGNFEQSPPALTDEIEVEFYSKAGLYLFEFFGLTAPSCPKIDFKLNGNVLGNVDLYTAVTFSNAVFSFQGTTIEGKNTFGYKVNGFNPSALNAYVFHTLTRIAKV